MWGQTPPTCSLREGRGSPLVAANVCNLGKTMPGAKAAQNDTRRHRSVVQNNPFRRVMATGPMQR